MPSKATLVLSALLVSRVALGQGAEPGRDAARKHYQDGLGLVERHDFERALTEFRAAYAASPQFAVLYNIGQTCIALDRPADAVSALEQYLDQGKLDILPERREQVARQIATLKTRTAELAVVTHVPGATIELDGQEIGRSPLIPLRVNPGDHVVSARAEDGSRVTRSVKLLAGDRVDLRLEPPVSDVAGAKPTGILAVTCGQQVRVWIDGTRVVTSLENPRMTLDAGQHRLVLVAGERTSAEQRLDVAPGSTVRVNCAEALPHPVPAPPPHSGAATRTWGYVVLGLGAGLSVGAFGHYLWNLGRYEEWKTTHAALAHEPDAPDYVERQTKNNELATSIEQASRVTVSLAVGGAALSATGVTLLILGHDGPAPTGGKTGFALSAQGVW